MSTRRRRSRDEIEALVDRFESSGSTQVEFARELGVGVSTLQGVSIYSVASRGARRRRGRGARMERIEIRD